MRAVNSAPTVPVATVPQFLRRAGPLALLLVGTVVLAMAGQPIARLAFIGGCLLVAWDLRRFGAAAHMSGSMVLFCTAPLLRRLVDLHTGYEASGIMISGPLLGLLVTAPAVLSRLADGKSFEPALRPFMLALVCCFYGALLTVVLDGNILQTISGLLKWAPPAIYGIWLYGEAKHDAEKILNAVTRTVLLLAPVLGLYGFLQYVNPPDWDRFWMTYTSIASIGQPEPFMVRVFSTMNAPAGYATFTAAALLLIGFRKADLSLLLAAGPSVLGLMLSMYRTAWIGLAVGIAFGLFHGRTWRRAAILLAAVPMLGAAVILFTPAGDALEQRLETFGAVSDDASGQERLAEYAELLNADNGTLLGHGFGSTDVLQAGALALDGQFVVTWFTMGLVVGLVSVSAVLWAALQSIVGAWRNGSVPALAVAGIMAGALVQLPLAVVSTSETGFLFWSFAALGPALGSKVRRKSRSAIDPISTANASHSLTSR